jgi:hypothetical protein
MLAELSPPMSVANIQLNLKQKINTKGTDIRGCSLLPDGKMVFSCFISSTVRFVNKEGVELFQIDEGKPGANTYDTVYITDNNSVAVLSGWGDKTLYSYNRYRKSESYDNYSHGYRHLWNGSQR